MNEVTVTRPRHPLAGRRLQVIGAMRRLGRDELLVVLPDGSKTLIPAVWTNRDTTTTNEDSALGQETAILAAPAELLGARELVVSLCARADSGGGQAARKSPCKEDDRAACAAEFDARTDPGATTGSDRVSARARGRRRDQDSGSVDCVRRHGDDDGGRR
jgi:hypothetical protein